MKYVCFALISLAAFGCGKSDSDDGPPKATVTLEVDRSLSLLDGAKAGYFVYPEGKRGRAKLYDLDLEKGATVEFPVPFVIQITGSYRNGSAVPRYFEMGKEEACPVFVYRNSGSFSETITPDRVCITAD